VPQKRAAFFAFLDVKTILKSLCWLSHQDGDGCNTYIRHRGLHISSMVDDLTRNAVVGIKLTGFNPAPAAETSAGNFQAWFKAARAHPV
jgi:hypothetical protein